MVSLPPVRRWHAAPPRHECRQHSCRTRCSCRVFRRRQTVVPTERLNPDKSEALVVGTANQLFVVDSSSSSVSVAGVHLPVAEDMKVLGVILDRCLKFHKHVSMVARSWNYHAQAIRHIRHLLTTELAQTLACSLILSRIDYCNAVLHGAPTSTTQKLQPVQNNAARTMLQASRRSLQSGFYRTLIWPAASTSEVTTVWLYRNSIIIIIIIKIKKESKRDVTQKYWLNFFGFV